MSTKIMRPSKNSKARARDDNNKSFVLADKLDHDHHGDLDSV